MLHIQALTVRVQRGTLLEDSSLRVASGSRVGLVGPNGCGKSTLLNLIAGDIAPDAGSVRLRRGIRIGRVAQEAPGGARSLVETVLDADEERAALLAEADQAAEPRRIAAVHERLNDIDAHAAPSRAASILAGLGFDDVAQALPCESFSGGWRMRVALAAALFARPDLLLLDEPTNHLDLESTLWLERFLARWKGALVLVSHERSLLNAVVQEIVHVEGKRLVRYAGDYDRFETLRRERQAQTERLRRRQEAERKRIQSFVDRFRAKATKARQAQSRIKLLARMEPIAAAIESPTVAFDLPAPGSLAPPLMAVDGAAVGYAPGNPVLQDLDLRIDPEDRIALLGANGNGKSTLIRFLAGTLAPFQGSRQGATKMRIGYMDQHQAESLDPGESGVQYLTGRMPEARPAQVRAHLGRFGLIQDKGDTAVGNLSGGEKTRLLLALMTVDKPHLLLLDEPTNHLDVDAREALMQALNAFSGAVILVSHDSHFIELVCERLWLVADGTCRPFDGDLADYRAMLLKRRAAATPGDRDSGARKARRQERADQRGRTAALRQATRQAEKRIAALNRQRQTLESRLADGALYEGSAQEVVTLQQTLASVLRDLESAESAWLEAHEALEAVEEVM